jgi:hypothetical protein
MEYAAAMMSVVEYRTLTLSERGLLYSMRLECWVNHSLPESPSTLARILGYDVAEVKSALPAVMKFFSFANGQIVSPDLEDYRAYLKRIRDKQKEGGKRGAELSNKNRNSKPIRGGSGCPTSNPKDNPQVTRTPTRGSSVQSSPIQLSQNQSSVKGINLNDNSTDQWIADYDKASNGG